MQEHSNNSKPVTQQGDLAKLPRALVPLLERPQWCVWKWTQRENGRWQKPPFQALDPRLHASTKDPSTWSDYATALATVQAGKADGISYVLTGDGPFAAIDLDHCRDASTGSVAVWAQNFLEVARHTYSEVTPSGEGCRIWGLAGADSDPVHKKYSLEIDGKPIAAELFRRTAKALTITGYTLDRAIRELTSIDKSFAWATAWGERRKAAAEAAVAEMKLVNGCSFNGGGPGYDVAEIEQLVREGVTNGANRSDTFHAVVGHYLGCGWSIEQIDAHLRQFPDGIAGRYLSEGRLCREITRSADKYNAGVLPLAGGWTAPETVITPPPPPPPPPDPEVEPDLDDDLDDDDSGPEPPEPPDPLDIDPPEPDPAEIDPDPDPDDELEDPELGDDELGDETPASDPKLPKMYSLRDKHSGPLKSWLIKHLLSTVGHGLLSGQWGTGKTFIVCDLVVTLATGQPFLGHPIKRQCGTMLIAAEGEGEVRLRMEAACRHKGLEPDQLPLHWFDEEAPKLLQKDAVKTLIAMARQADAAMRADFGLPLGLIVVDTVAAGAGYTQSGADNDAATGAALMGVLKTVARALGCFALAVDHLGKNKEAGTRGTGAKEDAADVIWILLGEKSLSGSVTNTRLAIRKHRGGKQGEERPFSLREVAAPELDEDGEPETTLVVDWQPAGAPGSTGPEPDPWAECRRQDQRTAVLRLKRVLMGAMADQGVSLPIPPDGPTVQMIDQEAVRELFYAQTPADGTPEQKSHSRRQKFLRALDWAEQQQLIGITEIDGVSYLRLTRPDQEEKDES